MFSTFHINSNLKYFHFPAEHSLSLSLSPNSAVPWKHKRFTINLTLADAVISLNSAASPVQGMDRVVATVSGYHGSERFNLIRLISHAGANYVGSMSKSITHLICWKFEGRKYEIAQKFDIIIVNHRWIEDCIKEGRRVPEESYILQSGYEVGPLLLEVPISVPATRLTKNKVITHQIYDIDSGEQTTEISFGASENSVWEDLNTKHDKSIAYPSRRSRKGKRSICAGNGGCTVAEPSPKGRRIVNNIVDEVVLDPLLDVVPDNHHNRWDRRNHDAAATTSLCSGVNKGNTIENGETTDAGLSTQNETINGTSDSIEEIDHSNNVSALRSSTFSVEYHLPMTQMSTDTCSSAEKFTDDCQDEHVAGLPTSSELSCVICHADFSATRGILPCGHRFCFECIHSWANHRTSTRKNATCPLCKASFQSIKKVEHADKIDQKVYTQTVPCHNSAEDVFIAPHQGFPDYPFEFVVVWNQRISLTGVIFAKLEESISIAWTLL
ncbi:uncharacterized protein [Arachis hypogaea]|uniref:uncharacterized protein isoform X3 n=2 Tax=Arachis TaxID=3817 RepID=UPI003B20F232